MAFFQSGLFHDTLGKPCVTIMARIWLFLPHDLKIGIYLSDLTEFVFFLSIASLLTVQLKKRKNFLIFSTFLVNWFKSAILAIFPKWHFWTGALNLILLSKSILMKHYENDKMKKYPRVRQIQDLGRKKYKKGIF